MFVDSHVDEPLFYLNNDLDVILFHENSCWSEYDRPTAGNVSELHFKFSQERSVLFEGFNESLDLFNFFFCRSVSKKAELKFKRMQLAIKNMKKDLEKLVLAREKRLLFVGSV